MSSLPAPLEPDCSAEDITKQPPTEQTNEGLSDMSKITSNIEDDKSLRSIRKQSSVNRFLENDSSSSSDTTRPSGRHVAKPLPKMQKKKLTFASSSSSSSSSIGSSDEDVLLIRNRSLRKRTSSLKSRGDEIRKSVCIDGEERNANNNNNRSSLPNENYFDSIQFTRHHSPLDITLHACATNSPLETLYYKAANTSATACKMTVPPTTSGMPQSTQICGTSSAACQDVAGQQLTVNTSVMMIHGARHHVTTLSAPNTTASGFPGGSGGGGEQNIFESFFSSKSSFRDSFAYTLPCGLSCIQSTSGPSIHDNQSSRSTSVSSQTKKRNQTSVDSFSGDIGLKSSSPDAITPLNVLSQPIIPLRSLLRTVNTNENVGNDTTGVPSTVIGNTRYENNLRLGGVAAGTVGSSANVTVVCQSTRPSQHIGHQIEVVLSSEALETSYDTASDLKSRNSNTTHLTMEHGDTYVGQVAKLDQINTKVVGTSFNSKKPITIEIPHGYGTLQSSSGHHCYVGDFREAVREGRGKLATNRFVIWGKWRNNRIDTTASVRIDFINGDRYCGYVVEKTDESKFNQLVTFSDPKSSTKQRNLCKDSNFLSPMSIFSCWVNSTTFEFTKWGELLSSSIGVRYFGQWRHGVQQGFGTQIFPTGDRYVGMFERGKYHGTGTFFTAMNRGCCLDCIQKAEAAIMRTETIDHAQVRYLRYTFESITMEIEKNRQKIIDGLLSKREGDSAPIGGEIYAYDYGNSSKGSNLLQLRPQNIAGKSVPLPLPSQYRNEENETMKQEVSANVNEKFLDEFPNCGFAMKGEPLTSKGEPMSKISTTGLPHHSPLSALPRDGITFDGVWQMGHFQGEGSHVILPDRTRITATWTDFLKAKEGKIFGPNIETKGKRWRVHFHWEALYQSSTKETKMKALRRCTRLRHKLRCCSTKKQLAHLVQKFITDNINITTGIKVFRRFFYAAFGTCGSKNEIGAGSTPSSSHKGDDDNTREAHENNASDSIGWCSIKKTFGGCIHQGKGRPIVPDDLEMALTDIMSFLASLRRYIEEMLEEPEEESTPSGSDNDENVATTAVGASPPPRNHEYKEVHDSNERYEAALDAFFDLDGPNILSRSLFDKILPEVYPLLMNLYANVHASENRAVEVALQKLHGITLDDLGVTFGRHMADEKLFNPYAEAMNALRSVAKSTTLSEKLSCLCRWSVAIDTSTKMAQLRLSEGLSMEIEGVNSLSNCERSRIESGSTDDLLPIHQFVLIHAAVPGIFLDARLLLDLSSDDHLIDMTSQDNFCITTLQACVSTVTELDIDIRDENGVVTPVSIYSRRVKEALMSTVSFVSTDLLNYRPLKVTLLSILAYQESKHVNNVSSGSVKKSPRHFENFIRYLHSQINIPLTLTSPQQCSVKTFSYIQSWVPTVLAVLSEHADRSPTFFWWRQKHVAYQQYLHQQKLAKKSIKINNDGQNPNINNTAVLVSQPPVLYLPIECFSNVAPLSDIVPLTYDIIMKCLNENSDTDYSIDSTDWQELVEISTRRELLLTQRICGLNDTPQAFSDFSKCVSSNDNENHEKNASDKVEEAFFMKEEERLTRELHHSISSRTLASKVLSKLDLLHAWYMTLSNVQRIQFQLGRDISHAAKCLAAADITLCFRADVIPTVATATIDNKPIEPTVSDGSNIQRHTRWTPVIDTALGSAPKVSKLEDGEAMVELGARVIKLVSASNGIVSSYQDKRLLTPLALALALAPSTRCNNGIDSDGESEWSFQDSGDDEGVVGAEDPCNGSSNDTIPDGATFAFRFDNCHESSVYIGVARAMLQCDPRERL